MLPRNQKFVLKMRLLSVIFAFSSCVTNAFISVTSAPFISLRKSMSLKMSSEAQNGKKPLTAADILARSKRAIGAPEENESQVEVLFSDAIIEDFRNSLLLLEERAKKGHGSLSKDKIGQLGEMTSRILADMDEKLATGVRPKRHISSDQSSQEEVILKPNSPVSTHLTNEMVEPVADLSDDDGPAYDGKGGMGLAKGTTNTYYLPGMDEMTPEEYREALQASISARQKERQKSGSYGNINSNSYLDRLNKKDE